MAISRVNFTFTVHVQLVGLTLYSQANTRNMEEAVISLLLTAGNCCNLTITSQILCALCVSCLFLDSAFDKISGYDTLLYIFGQTAPITKQLFIFLSAPEEQSRSVITSTLSLS